MEKLFIYGGVTVGSLVGAYLPVVFFHVSIIGFASIVGSIIGCFVGLWAGYEASQMFEI